jgi:DNA-binding beta-propeller fold protein YncE
LTSPNIINISNIQRMKTSRFFFAVMAACLMQTTAMAQNSDEAQLVHPAVGTTAAAADSSIRLTIVSKHQNFNASDRKYLDADVHSPKSANIHPDGKKYYVNSLEGCATVVYDMQTHKKIKVIKYRFTEADSALWSKPSQFYPFTHYTENLNTFMGKPVESTFSHGGRYLWIPFYRRTYDLNAQDPSAVAIIDTRTDEIVKLMETGPLPKMVATSHDGRHVAITHWGNNTVGIVNVASTNPDEWYHEKLLVVDYVLPLNFSLTEQVDRDNKSGYCLRGTVFTPDDRYLLVGCMGGNGGIAVIDMQTQRYMGRLLGMMPNVRHLVIKNDYLYLSINRDGYVQRIPLKKFMDAASRLNGKVGRVDGWQNCKVGAGARTITPSPSGNYMFAACNMASKLCVVDTRTMKMVAAIDIDSYPVGLDISNDGRYLIVTSQGRRNKGGNAVNICQADYAEAEPVLTDAYGAALLNENSAEPSDSTLLANATIGKSDGTQPWIPYAVAGMGAVVAGGLFFMLRRRRVVESRRS